MNKGKMPFIGISGGDLDLSSFPLGINAGVTTSHLQKRMAEEVMRRAASEVVKIVEPVKPSQPTVQVGKGSSDGQK